MDSTSMASLAKPNISFRSVPNPSRYSTFSAQFCRRPTKRWMDYSVTFLKLSSRASSMAQRRAKLPVFSQFRRPPRRRNSLREKLIPRQDQVTLFPEPSNPESTLGNLYSREYESNGHGLGMNSDTVKESAGAGDFKKNSVLWDKLENWVDRFKEDSEFWGIGTGPIFTIFQGSDGNVTRVSVNEDEILNRNRIRTLSLESNHETGELKDVNSKISRARVIAKEIEIGAYHMPRNSSIAKFVVDGNKSTLSYLLHAFSSRREVLIKIFPGIGLAVLCCFCVSGLARKLFVWHNDVELTREEMEMLRRKRKSRAERKELPKGSVEVLPNGNELPLISGTAPRLDRNELTKSIAQAKKSQDSLVLSESLDHFYAKNHDFGRKVREIRDMVKKVHEVEEHHNQSSKGLTAEQDDLISTEVDTEFQHYEERSAKEHNQSLKDHSESLSNKVDAKRDKVDNNSVSCEHTRKSLCVTSTSKRGRPKVITSLKEAKEYLSTKCRIPIGSVQPEKPNPLKGSPETVSSFADRPDGSLDRLMESAKNSGFAPGPSDFKLDVNDDKVNKLSVDIQHILEMNLAFQNRESNGRAAEIVNVDGPADLDDILMEHSGDIKLDCLTSGTKIHNQTFQHYRNQSYDHDRTSQSKQVAISKDIQSDNSFLNVTLDQDDGMMLKKLSRTKEHRDKQLDHVAEAGRSVPDAMTKEINVRKGWPILTRSNVLRSSESECKHEIIQSSVNTKLEPIFDKCGENDNIVSQFSHVGNNVSGYSDPCTVSTSFSSKSDDALENISSKASILLNSSNSEGQNESLPNSNRKNWVEENFQQFDSIIEKIGTGFKENYTLAKVKAQENFLSSAEIGKLGLWGEDDELEWMKDDNLLEIVFQVRENELAGRDPFYLMDADDQQAFFLGLERKAEKVNEKLAGMHEWIHSKIENLDYGTDGISLDDPLEKIIPRWKGPPIDQDPEFLKKFTNSGSSVLAESIRNLDYNSKANHDCLQKSENLLNPDCVSPCSSVNDRITLSGNGTSRTPKTIIECSDGSSRPGKKKMKEQWQHTKRWSQGFLEVYNAETDPEVKSVLKDMGKDLDRWITEKEIKDVADMMTRMPKKKRRFIDKKMNRIKTEVEMYGAQAVVSKYKEYANEKEEDYLWWLDLKFVLCIELYSVENDAPRIGFYSLEMAEDLELNPKQYHVIAFEDAGDSKNFCHIVQAEMDMLGNGKAFVVPRPPKEAFREAKDNGFSLTLIRKGEIKINVDQTLEEVEEELKELGSKIYHDKIMNERGVSIHSLMKGVIAANSSSKT